MAKAASDPADETGQAKSGGERGGAHVSDAGTGATPAEAGSTSSGSDTEKVEEIDASWWANALPASVMEVTQAPEPGSAPIGWELPEISNGHLANLLAQASPNTLQYQVLDVLTQVSSAMLEPSDWNDPFRPAIDLGDRRTPVPSDLDPAQLALLTRIAPLLDNLPMRARAADAAWTYAVPPDPQMMTIALDSYLAGLLETNTWAHVSGDGWKRAMEILIRRGKGERTRREAAITLLCDRLLSGTLGDGFMLLELGELIRRGAKLTDEQNRELADMYASLAGSSTSPRLARHLERAGQAFLLRLGAEQEHHDATVRIATTYEEQAVEVQEAARPGSDLFFEKAVKTLAGLPRAYRTATGVDARVDELRARLADSRQLALESMAVIDAGSIELTEYVQAAENSVTGLERFEALVALISLYSIPDAGRVLEEARSRLRTSILRLVTRTTYAADGRKIASTAGTTSEVDDEQVWDHAMRGFGERTGMVTQALIFPALGVINLEHRFDMPFLRRLCHESPVVPPGHVELWSRGLLHGLNGDFTSAVSVLVPQLEHMVRVALQQEGVHTLFVDQSDGTESEKGLGALLTMDEASDVLGSDLLLELRALMVEQSGPNLRNDVAHGLFDDGTAWSYTAVYAWWLALRLVVLPISVMTKSAERDGPTTDDSNKTADQ